MSQINSFFQNEEKKSFMNKFSNLETYYKKQDEKKSLIGQENLTPNRNTLTMSMQPKRQSRKSIVFSPSPRKSFMYDSKGEVFNSANDKNKTILRTIDLNKCTSDQLLDFTVTVLQKPANYRSQSDIKILMKATENIKFFQEVSQDKGSDIHEQICKYMTHKYLASGEVVFNEGTIGTTFYIILKGSVSVCKLEQSTLLLNPHNNINGHDKLRFSFKKADSIVNQLGLKRSESIISDANNKSPERKTGNSSEILQSPTKMSISPERNVMTEVRVLEIGNSFGELALIENKPRAATIKCKENCHFAVLDKQFFVHILKEKEQKKLFQHIDFFSNLLLFKHWSYNEVKNLKLHSEIIDLKRNKFVYKEGDESEFFYVVRSGEFKLLKELNILSDQELMDKKVRQTNIPKFTNPHLSKKTLFDIAILMPGEFFGEEELIESSNRKFSVLCVHPGSLYSINKKEFFRRILNDASSKTHLLKELKEKQKWRGSRLREYIFTHNKSNTFLKELSCYKNLLQDFSITEMDLLLKTEDLGDQDIFSDECENFDKNEAKAKIALKSKISNILNKAHSSQANDFFLLGLTKKINPKANTQPNQTLYDYFMESHKKKYLNGDYDKIKKIMKNKKINNMNEKNQEKSSIDEKKEPFYIEKNIIMTLPILGASPLKKKINEKMHLFLNLPLKIKSNNKSIEKRPGFLSDRRDYYQQNKPKTIDFGIDLLKKKEKITEFKEEPDDFKANLPLKYRSREIYQKILEKNKKIRSFREKSIERGGFQSVSSRFLP